MKTAVCLALIFFVLTGAVSAGDYNFETTAEGIEQALTKPQPVRKFKTRGIKTRGFKKIQKRGIQVFEEEKGAVVEKTIMVAESQSSQGVNLKIEFDPASANIRPDSMPLLNELGKALTGDKLKAKKIFIQGHTDSDGDDKYNLKLSLDRGLSVKQHLIANFSIAPDRLKIVGYGESMPLVPNLSDANKQLNRRVEIKAGHVP